MMKMIDVFAEVGKEGWLVVLSLFQGLLTQFIQFIDHGNCVESFKDDAISVHQMDKKFKSSI